MLTFYSHAQEQAPFLPQQKFARHDQVNHTGLHILRTRFGVSVQAQLVKTQHKVPEHKQEKSKEIKILNWKTSMQNKVLEITKSATDVNCNYSLSRPQIGSNNDIPHFLLFFMSPWRYHTELYTPLQWWLQWEGWSLEFLFYYFLIKLKTY